MGKRPTRSPLEPGADAETTALYNRLAQALDTLGPADAPFEMPEAVPWFRRKVRACVSPLFWGGVVVCVCSISVRYLFKS